MMLPHRHRDNNWNRIGSIFKTMNRFVGKHLVEDTENKLYDSMKFAFTHPCRIPSCGGAKDLEIFIGQKRGTH